MHLTLTTMIIIFIIRIIIVVQNLYTYIDRLVSIHQHTDTYVQHVTFSLFCHLETGGCKLLACVFICIYMCQRNIVQLKMCKSPEGRVLCFSEDKRGEKREPCKDFALQLPRFRFHLHPPDRIQLYLQRINTDI